MRSEGFLKAERALAQHSDRLAVRAPEPAQLASLLGAVAPRLERSLADAIAPLLGEERPVILCSKVEKMAPAKLHKIIDLVAVNYMLEDAGGAQMLASLNLSSALSLTDLVFGGPGNPPSKLPERLPKATDLALKHFADALGEALGTALELPDPLGVAARSDVLGKLVRARDEETLLVMRCTIALAEKAPWELVIALRRSHAVKLLAETGKQARPDGDAVQRGAHSAPFAKLPLPMRAVLAEMLVPVSRISALKPGDTLPLAIPREVPLQIEDIEIARGQVGASEGMLALRLTKTAWNEKENR